eukprot:s284_g1.t1
MAVGGTVLHVHSLLLVAVTDCTVVLEVRGWSLQNAIRRFDLPQDEDLKYKFFEAFDEAMLALENRFKFMASPRYFCSRKDDSDKVVIFEHGDCLFVFNFHPKRSYTEYRVGHSWNENMRVVLDSDEPCFGGQDRLASAHETSFPPLDGWDSRYHSAEMFLPSRTVQVLVRESLLEGGVTVCLGTGPTSAWPFPAGELLLAPVDGDGGVSQGQAVQVPESDLECMLGEPRERENSHEGRKCGWQCAAAAFVLGLLMMTVFALTRPTSLTSLTNSGVTDTVQMESMEDPVWKEVLGHKAFKQFEAERHQTAIASTQSTSTTSVATTVATTTVATEPVSTVARSVPVLTAAPTAAPVAIATIAPSETSKIIIFGTSGKSALEQIAAEFKDEAGKLNPESEEHKSLESISKMLSKMGEPVTHAPSKSPMTIAAETPLRSAVPAAKPAAVNSPLAPHEALKDGNTCPSDEEESEGTCYKKCADLTGGYYPIRTSAFSCCAAEPCSFFNSKILGCRNLLVDNLPHI